MILAFARCTYLAKEFHGITLGAIHILRKQNIKFFRPPLLLRKHYDKWHFLAFFLHFFKVHMFWEGHKFCEISTLHFIVCSTVKSKVEISQKFYGLLRIYEFYPYRCLWRNKWMVLCVYLARFTVIFFNVTIITYSMLLIESLIFLISARMYGQSRANKFCRYAICTYAFLWSCRTFQQRKIKSLIWVSGTSKVIH